MAKRTRKNTKSVYERIEETLLKIEETEKVLSDLRELLDELYAEKDDLEMRQTWSKINSIGLSMDDINILLSENMLAQLKSNSDTKAKENYVVCQCNNVSYFDILEALQTHSSIESLMDVFEDVKNTTHCSTGCGGCHDKVVTIISEALSAGK